MDEGLGERLDAFWAQRLACKAALLRAPGIHLLGPDPDATRPGLFLLARNAALLLRGEDDASRRLAAGLAGESTLPDAPRVRSTLGGRAGRIIGPVLLGYRERAPEIPPGADLLRTLVPGDRAALARLRSAVTDEEWEHAGLEAGTTIVGAFDAGRLVAAAGVRVLLGAVAHLGVLTHPTSRACGVGRRVVAAAAGLAASRGLLLQYQTLASNAPSRRIAERLGFEPYATSLAVRLVAQGLRPS